MAMARTDDLCVARCCHGGCRLNCKWTFSATTCLYLVEQGLTRRSTPHPDIHTQSCGVFPASPLPHLHTPLYYTHTFSALPLPSAGSSRSGS